MNLPEGSRGDGSFPAIAGYTVESILGRGATGVVYRAKQLSVDREVALKVMHPELVRNARSIKRLKREARTAARLAHPNLISSIDMGETAGTWWFAMELVHGEALSVRLERGRLKEREALPIFIKLADALEHASQKDVVHRDIKPANILLEKGDNPRLVDLGLARVSDDPMLTRTGATLGTPHYISPEQARDPALADVRSDIWSLGATLFHTVCGRPPFNGTATAEILSSVLYGAIPDPAELRPELSKGLVLVLRKCLSRDPDRRYHTPAELLEDLRLVQLHKPPAIKRSALEPLDPARSRERRQSVVSLTGLGLALALIVVLAVWRPWSNTEQEVEVPSTVTQPLEWARLTRLQADIEAGNLLLGDAWVELRKAKEKMPTSALAQWNGMHDSLLRELERTLVNFYAGASTELSRMLTEHDFEAAQDYLDLGLAVELGLTCGFAGPALPRERERANYLRFMETQREKLQTQRAAALATAARRIEQWAEDVYFPQLERMQARGRWTELRELLARENAKLYVESGADLRGLELNALDLPLHEVLLALEVRVQQLPLDWRQLDSNTLRKAVGALADELEAQLRTRKATSVGDDFEARFDALLAAHDIDRETLDEAPEHYSLDYFMERKVSLRELEETLLEQDALARLAALDDEAEALYGARRYEDALVYWESHREDPDVQASRDMLEIRVEEAQELVAFLQRAAQGVRALEGREVSLKQGSIAVTGEVELRGDPLARGLSVEIARNTTKDYVLRKADGVRGDVLVSSALELFAIQGADIEHDLGLLKQRAIFRYREGDYEGAAELLRSELLAAGELLIYDLGLRIDGKLGREQDILARRREHAQAEATRLTKPGLPQGDRQRIALQIGKLLREYEDVLDAGEEASLRKKRAQLERRVQPSTREEFTEAFGPGEVRFWSQTKVGMTFTFDSGEVGAWQRGDWIFGGDDCWRGNALSSFAELDRAAVPTLLLRDPLLLDDGTTTVTVTMRQPQDSPPELFVISALGFHAACVGPYAGRPPSLLVDTASLVKVAERARAGEGVEFKGLTAGAEHTITLRVSRASGKVVVLVDGARVTTANRVSPKHQPRSSSVSVRAFEPLELLGVQIEGTRR